MKTFIPLSALVALAASSSLFAQTPAFSKPSGYVTQTISQGFNLIGLTLGPSSQLSGKFTAVGTTSVTDSQTNFTTGLTAGGLYILEITSGTKDGLVVEIGSWTGNVLNTVDNLSSQGVAIGDGYKLTKAPTLEEIFGTTTSVLTKSSNSSLADNVWVPNGLGGYDRYFLNNSSAWRNAAGGAALNTPIVFLDGLFVQKRNAGSVSIVITGQVKSDATIINVTQGFNLVGTVFPAGSTLQSSGLDVTLKKNNNSSLADLVWVPTGPGTYARYFVNAGGAWRDAAGGAAPAALALTSAVFIQRRDAGSTQVLLTPPASYSNL
jgi:hypothetical protein